ncbi:MAG TPA: hypothetical protein VFF78_05335, partial [Anaerolineaceae bacterium]|nr:hypothetical protein [Anaerolineaceae bacterium]
MREILRGLIAVAICAAIVLGAFALAMAEGRGFGFLLAQTNETTPTSQLITPNGLVTQTPSGKTVQPSVTPLPPTS